jgi:hypothetical protein
MLTASVENLTERLEDLKPFFPMHWEELALNQKQVPLDPQYDVYLRKDAAGEVMLVMLRKAGEIVGYFVGFVNLGLHYQTCLTLTMDIFYVLPEHRGERWRVHPVQGSGERSQTARRPAHVRRLKDAQGCELPVRKARL